MRFGYCGSTEQAPLFRDAGFDFIEVNVQAAFRPQETDAAYATSKALRACALPVEAANCLLPGSLKLTGPERAPEDTLAAYMENACKRAAAAGTQTLVFGSGAARTIPEGTSREDALGDLAAFARLAAAAAQRHGVTIVLEPLNRLESNIFTTVPESAAFVREIAHTSFRLLVDSYHWLREKERPEALAPCMDLITHVHVATEAHRLPPGEEPAEFGPFLEVLRTCGYDGRVSIEANAGELTLERLANARAWLSNHFG